MGWFSKGDAASGPRREELDALRSELDALRTRLDAAEQAKISLEASLAELAATANTAAAATVHLANRPVGADPELVARVDGIASRVNAIDQIAAQLADLAQRSDPQTDLGSQLAQLAERMTANDQALRAATEQVALVEQRVTSVSVELANQIDELGRDIDALAAAPSSSSASAPDEVVESLRVGQVRLANEQARFEIAFREDLAALAEQVRRHR